MNMLNSVPLIVSREIDKEIVAELVNHGFKPLRGCQAEKLDRRISCHPDLQLLRNGDTILVTSDCYSYYRRLFDENAVTDTLSDCGFAVSSPYPEDCRLNIARFGKYTIVGEKVSPPSLSGKIVRVPQGYAGCSTLVFGSAAITDDTSIADALRRLGAEVLLLPQRAVLLDGFDCGFIGGSGFVFGNSVYFFGDLSIFPFGHEIVAFCHAKGFGAFSLSAEKIHDYGGAVALK